MGAKDEVEAEEDSLFDQLRDFQTESSLEKKDEKGEGKAWFSQCENFTRSV